MKKGLLCATLMAVSLVAGWCLADLHMWKSDTVRNSCTEGSTVTGKITNDNSGVTVTCIRDGVKLYGCEASSWPLNWCAEDTTCTGTTSTNDACYQPLSSGYKK